MNPSLQIQHKPTAAWASDFIQNQPLHATPKQVVHASQNMDIQIDMQPNRTTSGPQTQGKFHGYYSWVFLIVEHTFQGGCTGTLPFPISVSTPCLHSCPKFQCNKIFSVNPLSIIRVRSPFLFFLRRISHLSFQAYRGTRSSTFKNYNSHLPLQLTKNLPKRYRSIVNLKLSKMSLRELLECSWRTSNMSKTRNFSKVNSWVL